MKSEWNPRKLMWICHMLDPLTRGIYILMLAYACGVALVELAKLKSMNSTLSGELNVCGLLMNDCCLLVLLILPMYLFIFDLCCQVCFTCPFHWLAYLCKSILVMFDRLGLICHGHSLHVCCFSLELLFPICICWLQLSCKKLLMRRWGSSEDLCNQELHFRLCLDMW